MRAGGMCNQFWTDCIINKQQNAWNHCVYESDDDEMSYGLNLHGLIPVHPSVRFPEFCPVFCF